MTPRAASFVLSISAAWAMYENIAWLAGWLAFGSGMCWGLALGEKYLLEGLKMVKLLEVELERERQAKRGG